MASRDGRKSLLLVGDSPSMRALYRTLFAKHGDDYSVRLALDAARAVGHVWREGFDAVVMDWDLSGDISGREFLKALRRIYATKEAPVLVAITERFARNQALALKLGATSCLPSPFDAGEALARLSAIPRRTA